MTYYEVLIQTMADGTHAKALYEHTTLAAAKQACYAELAAGMASASLRSVMVQVIDDDGGFELGIKEAGAYVEPEPETAPEEA